MIEVLGIQADAIRIIQILLTAFLAVLFLQSGFDKVFDWQGNLAWMTPHFVSSPLRRRVPLLLGVVTVLEVAAGLLCGVGAVALILDRSPQIALAGAVIAAVNILALFLGQRVAKDYAGAAVLVNYFLLVIVAIFFLS